tara:strand:+ start:21691 stop:21858 length:168 start_codon:yes stop_codon:yes gene_type:complete
MEVDYNEMIVIIQGLISLYSDLLIEINELKQKISILEDRENSLIDLHQSNISSLI